MTTPEPRVRVWIRRDDYDGQYVANWRCPGCGGAGYLFDVSVPTAHDDARAHATTCSALRLAWLLRELEALRDEQVKAAEEWFYSIKAGGPPLAKGFRMGASDVLFDAAADLAAILGRLG